MKTCVACPICGDRSGRRHAAPLAPFIRAWVHPDWPWPVCSFRCCQGCGLGFFEQRFDASEMARLYGNYRSNDYLVCRRRFEPWYTAALNQANLSPGVIAARRSLLEAYLQQQLPEPEADRVIVDLGGDAGQFIPTALGTACYVLESSDREPWPGVSRIDSLEAVVPAEQLLLICAHVLEHLSDPVQFLDGHLQQARGKAPRVVLYLEVPLERFRFGPGTGSSLYRAYLELLQRPWLQGLWKPLDLLSLVARRFLGVVVPPLFLKLHEHINCFSEAALRRLIERLDLRLIDLQVRHQSGRTGAEGIIRLLAVTP